jgi:hypothetical protein
MICSTANRHDHKVAGCPCLALWLLGVLPHTTLLPLLLMLLLLLLLRLLLPSS